MSEPAFSPLSPIVYSPDTVLHFPNASLSFDFLTTFNVHTTIIHPWSTFFEQAGPCSKNATAPSHATGTGLLDSKMIPSTPSTLPKYYVRNILTLPSTSF
ncbi:hypothetical protein EU527_11180 [Candidatus Thorarchaeota archaeon]|nr:MAG: hypothetical protein EU527_11180 [Candidatus Thorarchaeota archaeon]